MYYLDKKNTYDILQDLASAASEYLAEYYSENGEEEFPETFSPWEEKGEYFRLFYVPAAREAECNGSDHGAWEKTIEAYADANNWRAGAWENL